MKKKGFTVIELMVVISIISLLSSIIYAAATVARNRGKYAQVISQMQEISKAALVESNGGGNYAPDVASLVPTYLPSWPTPPCPDWTYSWDYWLGGKVVRISLRKADASTVYYYCMQDNSADGGNCANNTDQLGNPADGSPIQNASQIICNE